MNKIMGRKLHYFIYFIFFAGGQGDVTSRQITFIIFFRIMALSDLHTIYKSVFLSFFNGEETVETESLSQ